MSVIAEFLRDDVKRSVLLLAVSAASLVLSFFKVFDLPFDIAWVAIILCGAPILWDAATGLILRHDIKADVLVAMAIIAAICLQEWFAAGEVALIMEIGGLLEDISAAKANKGIEKLISMTPKTGRVVEEGSEKEVPVEDIAVGSIVRVRPGESVPVDGIIVSGTTSIDQAVLTGESVPVDKAAGDEVFSGTMNMTGAFDMRSTKASGDSSMQRLADLAASVDAEKTGVVRIADRWATWLVALVMGLALATYLVTSDIYRAVTVMIVFCPCAFILATPTAVVAAMGNLTKHGVLVRDGDSLERMASVDVFTFDKTGTITEGNPSVAAESAEIAGDRFRMLAASAESLSEHPLGRAITDHYRSLGAAVVRPSEFSMTVGRGVRAVVDGSVVLMGNAELLRENGIQVPSSGIEGADGLYGEGCTVILIAVDGSYAGYIALSDTIRPESREAVSELGDMGIRTVLLTGDNSRAAAHMAAEAGISEVVSGCTPEGKLAHIKSMQSEGSRVCMIGDGVNDAPALRKAWVGMAMGGVGSDIAVESADMVLVGDRVDAVPHVVALCRKMKSKINANIAFSLCWNFMAVALAMFAVLGPVEGAIVHNVGSVAVVVNSALLLVMGRRSARAGRGPEPEEEASMTASAYRVLYARGRYTV